MSEAEPTAVAPADTETDPATAAPGTGAGRFPVAVEGYSGPLEQLVLAAQRGDIDLGALRVAEVTSQVGRQLGPAQMGGDLRDAAEALNLLARLVAIKASRLLPDGAVPEAEEEPPAESDAGRRLAEYRLFRAAADALLAEPAEAGALSFLGIVASDVIPVERLRIPPERLAAAFRAVLERLQENAPLPVGAVTFSVEDKATWLRGLLEHGPVDFEAIFAEVSSRLEAVACFLALLELLKRGEAAVTQESAFASIRVTASG